MNGNIDNKVNEADEFSGNSSPQNEKNENPWAELQRLLEQMELPGESADTSAEEKTVPAPHYDETCEKTAESAESKADEAEFMKHVRRGEAVAEQFQNELRQSLLELTNTLAEKGLLDKKTARKHKKRVKREAKLRQRELKRELKKKVRGMKKNGSA